jgi:hypothetical protein
MVEVQRQRYLAGAGRRGTAFSLWTACGKVAATAGATVHHLLVHEASNCCWSAWKTSRGEFEAEQRLMEANRRLQQQVELHEATEKLAGLATGPMPKMTNT